MKRFLLLATFVLFSYWVSAQGFEISSLQETYKGTIGETIKAPLHFKNTSEKPITLIIRKVKGVIGSTQKNYFCLDSNCYDQKIEDYIIKVEPGQTLHNFQIALDAGLVSGISSSVHYIAFNKSNPSQTVEFDVNFSVEEKTEKQSIYNSRYISLHDVYPNPAVDHAFVDYEVLSDNIQAKLRVHNILGNIVSEYELPASESLIRIRMEDLTAGIYFYTLYIENESVVTRKLIVKK